MTEAKLPFDLDSIVYLIVRRRAKVTDKKFFSYVKETIVTQNNFWRIYTGWGETAFATRSDAERRLGNIDS